MEIFNSALDNRKGFPVMPHVNHTYSITDLPRYNQLNPPKGRVKFFSALKKDGLLEKFKKGELEAEIVNRYLADNIPPHELEIMAKAAERQKRRESKRFCQSTAMKLVNRYSDRKIITLDSITE